MTGRPDPSPVPRTPVMPTRPAMLQPLPRPAAPARVLEPRHAPRQLCLQFAR